MHEVSIAQGLLDIAIDNCKKHGYQSIDSIKAKVGKASGIVPDSLLFSFEALKKDTIAGNATLTIEEIPVGGFCDNCKKHFTVDEAYVIACPLCGSLSFKIETGRELNVDEVEVS
jgi:hydrogenase nickel incorporation protein HypA/HybF